MKTSYKMATLLQAKHAGFSFSFSNSFLTVFMLA
jgi:hypothetical protein